MAGYGEAIEHELLRWDGVTVVPHRFGGREFKVDRRELGHIHGNRMVDLPFPVRIRESLVAEGRAELHHILPDSGWVTFYLTTPESVGQAIELFRLNYQRPWLQQPGAYDIVEEADEESFPASDPPAFGPTTGAIAAPVSTRGSTTDS